MLEVGINRTVTADSIAIAPQIELITEDADFTPRPVIEGLIVSPIRLIIAVGVATVLLIEHLARTMRR